MKKSNKIIAVCVLVIVLAIIIVPSILKTKVTKLMIEEIETNSDYQVKYDDLDVSFFRNFPHVKVDVKSFLLESPTETILDVSRFTAELSFSKVMKNELELLSADLQSPKVKYTLVEEVQSLPNTTEDSTQPTEEKSVQQRNPLFSSLKVESFSITDGEIHYQSSDSLNLILSDIDLQLEGHFDLDEVMVGLQFSIASVGYSAKGFSLKSIPLSFNGDMLYQIDEEQLRFNDNTLKVGGFTSSLVGKITSKDRPDFDISFDAPSTDIKSVLALLPKTLIQDLDNITADGEVGLNGYVKGKYENPKSLPAFGIDFSVSDAWFKYAELSNRVDGINVSAKVSHPQGTDLDSTVIAIDKLIMHSGENELNTQLIITNPSSDVSISGSVNSQLDFLSLKEAIPMKAANIVGQIDANITFDGKLSDIEEENYQDFDAAGQLVLKNYYLKSKAIPQGLSVSNAVMRFTPERINISTFSGKLGTSDLRLSGYLSNYFSYLFDDKPLNGVLKLNSKYFDINEFMAYDAEVAKASSTGKTTSTSNKGRGAFIVPSDLNIILNTSMAQAKVDNLILEQFNGKITVKDSKILLNDLNFKTLDGSVKVNGQYNSQKPNAVYSDMDLNIANVDVAKATKSVSVLRKMMPISQTTQGKVSSEMNYYTKFDAKGDVDLKSVKSKGYISSPGLRIANNASLDKLAKQLNDPRYRDITTSAVKIDYTMDKGTITLAPFDVKMVDKNINAGGWYSLDNQLSFRIKTTVKAKEIGGDVSKYIGMVSDVNKPLPVTIILTGDAKNPNVKYDTREAIKILRDDVTKNLNKDAINSILKGFF